LNVQVVTLPQSQVSLDVEVDSTAVGHAIDRAYQQLAQRYSVPGFRKGKAPRPVLEAAIGRNAVLEEASDLAVNDAYQWALKETGLEPITQPEVSMQTESLDPSQPLFFSAKFFVRPTVSLGNYRSIRVSPPHTPVDDDAVERVITRMAEREAPWEPVEDRPAAPGDMAYITMRGTVGDETVVDQEEEEYYLDPDAAADAFNLTPHLTDMALGDERDFTLDLPATFEPEQYAGKAMQCHVELRRLEHKADVVIDDAFAQSVGEYETVDALRERVRQSLESEQRVGDAETFVTEVMRDALDMSSVELPPPMVEDEIHRALDNLRETIESRRGMTMDLYLRVLNKTEEQLHEEARGPAETRVKSNLVLEAIADAEGIEAPRAEVDAELREAAALPTVRERDRRRIMTSPAVRARVETRMRRRLALQRLLEIADPKTTTDSADIQSDADATGQHVLQEAVASHAAALEGDVASEPGQEEI
jgi:trigger factor